MPPPNFPLRWESTGDQWWYASPIDCAAANGLHDVVFELLHQDANLLIKLTSLRRIRRLETLWDDDESNSRGVAPRRSNVARKLLRECESNGGNSLIRAGYGGWLLYTAASAGDLDFVKELLERDPLLVFGEGEYGATDMFYAATRGKNPNVFKILFDFSMLPAGICNEEDEKLSENQMVFRGEMMNRAVHGAARGGDKELLKELIADSDDVLGFRDVQGSTLLHTASGRGQVEVVKHLVGSCDTIICSKDNLGNTALHVAAYKGHLGVVETLIRSSPSLISITNNHGDTFLHMAVAGFRTPGFRRLDRQIELFERVVGGKIINLQEIVNVRNDNGRTALHMVVMDDVIQLDVAELLLKLPSIDLNLEDSDGMTPLDILKQRPSSASSKILIKRLVSAGGISNSRDFAARNVGVSSPKDQIFCGSPGTTFQLSDSEIFLYTNTENAPDASQDQASSDKNSVCSSNGSGYSGYFPPGNHNKKSKCANHSGTRLRFLLRWAKRKDDKKDEFSGQLSLREENFKDRRVPLRQLYSRSPSSLNQNSRTFSARSTSDLPSPSARMKFMEGLMQGVMFQAAPKFVLSPSSSFSVSYTPKDQESDMSESHQRSRRDLKTDSSANRKKFMNKYFCLDAQGLAADEDPAKRVSSLVA